MKAPQQRMNFNPAHWYWLVGNKAGVVFSSADANYVATDDAGYQQWLTDGGTPTNIDFDGELADVLTNYGAAVASPMAVRNCGWTAWGVVPVANQFAVIVKAGVTVVSTGTPSLNGIYAMDDNTRVRQNSNMNYITQNKSFAPNGAATKDWPDISGVMHTFPNTGLFQEWFTATGDWYSALADWNAAGGVGALPTEPVTIP